MPYLSIEMTKRVVVDTTLEKPTQTRAADTTCARCAPVSAAARRRSSHLPTVDLSGATCESCRVAEPRGTTRKTRDATCSKSLDVSPSKAKKRRGGLGSIDKASKVEAIKSEDASENEETDETWRGAYDHAVVPTVPGKWTHFTDEVVEGFEGPKSLHPNRVFFHLINADASKRVQAIVGVVSNDDDTKSIEYTVSNALMDIATDHVGRPFTHAPTFQDVAEVKEWLETVIRRSK